MSSKALFYRLLVAFVVYTPLIVLGFLRFDGWGPWLMAATVVVLEAALNIGRFELLAKFQDWRLGRQLRRSAKR